MKLKNYLNLTDSMKLILIRHGLTLDNEKGIFQGQTHGELSEVGKKQSSKLAVRLKNEKIDF